MKKSLLMLLLASAIGFTACNDSSDADNTSDTANNNGADTSTAANNSSAMPLESSDMEFVRMAAEGGMMEVEAGNIAQQNAANERVKAFASMMVRDHSSANTELKTFASSRGMMIPEDSLMMKHKDHLDEMRKMKGKDFDNHYMKMMVDDHKKTVDDFEKAANNVKDADLKAWAGKTLPTLKMHLDSAQAINKAKM